MYHQSVLHFPLPGHDRWAFEEREKRRKREERERHIPLCAAAVCFAGLAVCAVAATHSAVGPFPADLPPSPPPIYIHM